jgi:hypothetical protein
LGPTAKLLVLTLLHTLRSHFSCIGTYLRVAGWYMWIFGWEFTAACHAKLHCLSGLVSFLSLHIWGFHDYGCLYVTGSGGEVPPCSGSPGFCNHHADWIISVASFLQEQMQCNARRCLQQLSFITPLYRRCLRRARNPTTMGPYHMMFSVFISQSKNKMGVTRDTDCTEGRKIVSSLLEHLPPCVRQSNTCS